jgi:hypothetical protein
VQAIEEEIRFRLADTATDAALARLGVCAAHDARVVCVCVSELSKSPAVMIKHTYILLPTQCHHLSHFQVRPRPSQVTGRDNRLSGVRGME